VLSARTKGIDKVIVDGRIIVDNGRSAQVDETEVYAQANDSSRRLLRHVGRSVEHRWPHVD
jgi:hypothetical protein